jgi:hypothetical protein
MILHHLVGLVLPATKEMTLHEHVSGYETWQSNQGGGGGYEIE